MFWMALGRRSAAKPFCCSTLPEQRRSRENALFRGQDLRAVFEPEVDAAVGQDRAIIYERQPELIVPGVKRDILFREHFIDPSDKKAIFEINAEELFSIMDNLFKGVNLLIWLVGFGTLLAAAIGVSNIMMVTVKERTTEIGIRRAIGATPNMILSQVMMESMLLTLAFGFIGIFLSVGFLSLGGAVASVASETPADFQVSFGAAVLVVFILTVLGLLAGLAPALRAMNIKPVDAMRDE